MLERLSSRWGVIGAPAPPPLVGAARALAALGDIEGASVRARRAALDHARRWGAPVLLAALRARGR